MAHEQSSGERAFIYYWTILVTDDDIPEYEEQWQFHPTRKWALDFAWPDIKLAVEIDGGTWLSKHGKKGGHTTGVGYQKGCEKGNAAIILGWRVLRYTPTMLDVDPQLCITQILEAIGENDGRDKFG